MNFSYAIAVVVLLSLFRFLLKFFLGSFYYTTLGNALIICVSLGAIVFLVRKVFSKIDFFPNKPVDSEKVRVSIVITVSLFLLFTTISQVEKLLRIGVDLYFQNPTIFSWNVGMKKYFLGMLIAAPIFEELLIRGILLQGLAAKYKIRTAIIITTSIFVFLHIGKNDFSDWNFLITEKIAITLNCLFACWIMVKTLNIRLMILLHFIWNALNYVFPLIINVSHINVAQPIVFIILMIVIFLASSLVLYRNLKVVVMLQKS